MWHVCNYFIQFTIIGVLLAQSAELTPTYSTTNPQQPTTRCGRYNGTVCKDFLERGVRVVISSNETLQEVEKQLSKAFAEVLDREDILENCADNAKALLCHWIFPACGDDNRTLSLCNDSVCNDIRVISCSRDWTTLESRITAMGYFNISNYSCDTNAEVEENCTEVGFHDSCFVGDGRSYRGNRNTTFEGDPCQAWESQTPYRHGDTPDKHPSLAGHNFCRNPDNTKVVPFCHPRVLTANTDYNEVCGIPRCRNDPLYNPGKCFPVNSTWYCSKFLDSTRQIFAESAEFLAVADGEAKILFNVLITNPGLVATSMCLKLFELIMCHHFFPYCSLSPGFPAPINVCREDCETLRDVSCNSEYSLAVDWVAATGFKILTLPNCDSLSKINYDLRFGDQGCFELGFSKNTSYTSATYDCIDVNSRGIAYRGTQNTSESGRPCLFWSDVYPRSTKINPDQFPSLRGHNYCRNPAGNDHFGPFCYIKENGRIIRDLCKIPDCKAKNVDKPDMKPNDKFSFSLTTTVAISVPCGVIALLSFVILGIFVYRKRLSSKSHSYPSFQSPMEAEINPMYLTMELENLNLPEGFNFPSENLTFLEELGEGNFGKVMKAEAVNISGKEDTTTVAVKTLRESTSLESYRDFTKEVKVMMDIEHPNIVQLLGVSAHMEGLCMIFEYMAKGDLNQLLRSASPDVTISDKETQISIEEMIMMAEQIASGMVYLSQRHYVHRDLATRNCLVAEDNTVKLADFGLTRDIYSNDYYRVEGKRALPIRWMSPESIVYGKFTVSSDVWSFGIVLWEIFTFGKQPFYGISNEEVVELAAHKKIIVSPPPTCPFAIGNLMLQCCNTNPKKRPTFEDIHSNLTEMQFQQKQLS